MDHKNRNGLDNRLTNLRPATSSQNKGNRGPQRNNTSGFKGVSYDKQRRKWRVTVRITQRSIYCGLFLTKQDTARRYNEVARERFGDFA
jgi:hypothetical protein